MILDCVREVFVRDTKDLILRFPQIKKEIEDMAVHDFKDSCKKGVSREVMLGLLMEAYALCDYLDAYTDALRDIEGSDFCIITYVDNDDRSDGATITFFNLFLEDEEDALVHMAKVYKKYGFTEEDVKAKAVELEL